MDAETTGPVEVQGNGYTGRVRHPTTPVVIALRAVEVTGRLHDAVALAGALLLFVWTVASPDVIRLLGACGFSLVALALRWLRVK